MLERILPELSWSEPGLTTSIVDKVIDKLTAPQIEHSPIELLGLIIVLRKYVGSTSTSEEEIELNVREACNQTRLI